MIWRGRGEVRGGRCRAGRRAGLPPGGRAGRRGRRRDAARGSAPGATRASGRGRRGGRRGDGRRRSRRGRRGQRGQPSLRPVAAAVATDRRGGAARRGVGRCRPGDGLQPLRLRRGVGADHRGPAARGDHREGAGAGRDVAPIPRRARGGPDTGDGGAGVGLPVPRRAEPARGPGDASPARRPHGAGARWPRRAAHLDLARRRGEPGPGRGRRRARLGSGLARSERRAAHPARGGGRSRRRGRRAGQAGDRRAGDAGGGRAGRAHGPRDPRDGLRVRSAFRDGLLGRAADVRARADAMGPAGRRPGRGVSQLTWRRPAPGRVRAVGGSGPVPVRRLLRLRQLLDQVRRHDVVVVVLGHERATAAGDRAQVEHVPADLRLGHGRLDGAGAVLVHLGTGDPAAP